MSVDISVAICTYNRIDLLGGAISSLCQQSLPVSRFEIIIVDNGSTDNTVELVRDYQTKYPDHTIHLLCESQQGLGYARNRALEQAQGQYIAYLDDDAQVEPCWLAQALLILNEQTEVIICLGGPIFPFYTMRKPAWFKDAYESRSWGAKERFLQAGESFSGSNMIWHRAKILALGGFNERVGLKGRKLSLGEETDAFVKAWHHFEEPIMWYDPTLIVKHLVPAFKMKVSYRLKRAFVAGQVASYQSNRHHGRVYSLFGACKGIFTGGLKALWRYRKYPFWQNWAVEEGQPVMINFGTILAVLGIYVTVHQQ
jgi:glycosyltransferase involved in cell wall biosynthesis